MDKFHNTVMVDVEQAVVAPIRLYRSHGLGLFLWGMSGLVFLLLCFICIKSYTKTTTLRGKTILDKGVLSIPAYSNGVVSEIYASEGQKVDYGDALFKIRAPLLVMENTSSDTVGDFLKKNLTMRKIANLESALYSKEIVQRMEQKSAQRKLSLEGQVESIDKEIEAHNISIARAEINLSKYKSLASDNFVSDAALKSLEDDLTGQKVRKISLQRQRKELEAQLALLDIDAHELKLREKIQKHQYAQESSKIEAELNEVRYKNGFIVKSPAEGVVQSISVSVNDSVGVLPLAVIVPTDSVVIGEVWVPSRSIGFIEVGQSVRIRYRAYPYQKYGVFKGVVASVASVPANFGSGDTSVALNDTYFKIKLNIQDQYIIIQNRRVSLISGMDFDVDVELDSRLIVEWMFESIFSIKKYF